MPAPSFESNYLPWGHMNLERRAFLTLVGTALTIRSSPTSAQQPARVRTVGVLMGLADDEETRARAKAIEQGLAKKGWIVGQNLHIEYRFAAGDEELMHKFATELAKLHPDVIIGHSTPVVAALVEATRTIPIIFVVVSDPIGSGFVSSLARPEGNVTGFTNLQATITGKYLSILRLLVPNLTRVAIMYNPESATNSGKYYFPPFMESAKQFHVTPIANQVHSTNEIEAALTDLESVSGSALIVMPDNFTSLYRKQIVDQVTQRRIPTIYPYRYFVDEGGLLSYGVDVLDLFRRAPDYVDRILHGAKPSDLPVQAPKKFELVINMKAAHALGLTVPRILLVGADALID
jgi:putative tryptophan/tyrosine transport system substrate-binding protein